MGPSRKPSLISLSLSSRTISNDTADGSHLRKPPNHFHQHGGYEDRHCKTIFASETAIFHYFEFITDTFVKSIHVCKAAAMHDSKCIKSGKGLTSGWTYVTFIVIQRRWQGPGCQSQCPPRRPSHSIASFESRPLSEKRKIGEGWDWDWGT